jgi:hypothetical protein
MAPATLARMDGRAGGSGALAGEKPPVLLAPVEAVSSAALVGIAFCCL